MTTSYKTAWILTWDMGAAATINEIKSYTAWAGRIIQDYTVDVSVDGTNWTLGVVSVVNQGTGHLRLGWNNVEVAVTTDDSSPLATNVRYVRFNFPNQQNGAVGYQEFVVNGVIFCDAGGPGLYGHSAKSNGHERRHVTFTAQATGFPPPAHYLALCGCQSHRPSPSGLWQHADLQGQC